MAAIEEAMGRDAVVIAEASVIEQLAVMLRCSIGTMGGGWGATARCGDPRSHAVGLTRPLAASPLRE